MSMKIKKGDIIYMRAGKDRKKTGKIIRVFSKDGKILVEGINMAKKHRRARRQGQKGEIVNIPIAFPASRAQIVCQACGKPTRVGFRISEGDNQRSSTKTRICKKCNAEIG